MLKNIFSNWSNIFLSAVSVFLLYPYLTKVLGEQQYGVWLLISSVTGYFGLLQLGVPLANVRYVSKYYAQNDIKKVSEVLSSNLMFFFIVASVVMALGTIISFLMEYFFNIPEELKIIAQIATILASLDIAFRFVFEAFEGVVHGLQKFVLLNVVKNIGIVLRVGLVYVYVTHQNGIIELSLILIIISVLQGIVFFLITKRLIPSLNISTSLLNKDMFKEVAKYSIYVLVLQAGARLSFQTDAIVIGSFISVGAIIWFSIANNMMTYLMQFIVGISQALMPKISSLDAVGDHESLKRTYFEYSRMTLLLLLPICYGLFVFGGDFIALWMGEKYRQVSGDILSILTISYLFFLVQRGVAFPILMGSSKMKFLSILIVSTAILNLLLSIFLSRYYGLYGVAWGTAIPNFINVIAIIFYMCSHYRINFIEYMRKCLICPVLVSLPCLGIMIITRLYIDLSTYIHLMIAAAIGSAIYFALVKYVYFKNGFKSAIPVLK